MASPSFDTFRAARALEAAGVERSQAETIASAIAHTSELATKHDFRGLKSDFSNLKSNFSGLQSEFSNLESRMNARFSSLEARMYRALWIQGGAIVGIIAALNLLA